jgi:5'-nucleotidase
MLLLITNDDGIDSPGLAALADHLSALGEVIVVAPATEQSAKSHALTMHEPLRVHRREAGRFAVTGTPADCAYLGVHQLCGARPDFVISGINRGANLGDDIHYSGTVAGAREGVIQGVPGLAVSLDTPPGVADGDRHWETAAMLARHVISLMVDNEQPERLLLNLNVPNVAPSQLTRLHVTQVGRRTYAPTVAVKQDPRGRPYYWIGGDHESFCDRPGTDGYWHSRGHPTLSPLQLDPTAHGLVDAVGQWRSKEPAPSQ